MKRSQCRASRQAGNLFVALLVSLITGLPSHIAAQDSSASVSGLDSLLGLQISTAGRYARLSREASGAMTIMTAEDIERYGYRTLEEVFATIPGFYISNDRSYSYLGVRGFSRPGDFNNRVLLLLDGNVINEGIWGGSPVGTESAVPLRALERIEIIRGPASALYGTGAMFAVVNLVTKAAETLDGLEVSAQGGSYGQRGGSALFGSRLRSGTRITLVGLWEGKDGHDLFFPEYDASETHDGVAHNLDWERRWGILGSVAHRGLTFHGRYSVRKKGIPTAAYGADFNAAPAYNDDYFSFAELRYDRQLDVARQVMVRTYVNSYRYGGHYMVSGAPFADAGQGTLLGTEASLRWDLNSSNRLTFGAELRHFPTARYYIPGTDFSVGVPYTVSSAYVQDEHQLTRTIAALAGLRYDHYTTSGSAASPRIALIYTPSGRTTFKLLYGSAFRAPNASEAQVQTASPGTDPQLGPERVNTFEFLWQQQFGGRLVGSMSLYRYDIRDLIEYYTNNSDLGYGYRNVGRAEATGAEVSLAVPLDQSFGAYGSYSYVRSMNVNTDQGLSNAPEHLAKIGMSVQALPWIRPAVDVRYESSRLTLYGTRTNGFVLTDLHLLFSSAGILRGSDADPLALSVRINNLFDAAHAVPGGAQQRQAVIPMDGRNVSVELRYHF